MITTQDKVNLLKRITEIESMNLCSTETVKKASNINGTSSDKILENYPNNGRAKLENCYVHLGRNSISLYGVVEFFVESFNYHSEDKTGERFIGYSNNSIMLIEDDLNITSSIKLWFYVRQKMIERYYQSQELFDFIGYYSNIDELGYHKKFFTDDVVISWPVFKKICEEIATDSSWQEWLDDVNVELLK